MKLRQLDIKGFKSIDGEQGASIPFGDVTVLLGANGSGKSNLLSFFAMLHDIGKCSLSNFVNKYGANRLLFYGSKKTTSIKSNIHFEGFDSYCELELKHTIPDGLDICTNIEKCMRCKYHEIVTPDNFNESNIIFRGVRIIPIEVCVCAQLRSFFSKVFVYQFNDTSESSNIKDRCYADNAQYLYPDAGNLSAFLRMLKKYQDYNRYYTRIVQHIQRIMPQFGDFDLDSIPGAENYVRLNWKDASGSHYLFDPHQLSDGTLRFMALTTLLLQPPKLLPRFIILDEPELGLHPAAIAELAGMVKMAAAHSQVLLATQSTRLVDEFEPENVVVVERDGQRNCSVFKKLDAEALADWLSRYSLSELWEKNVLGGQP